MMLGPLTRRVRNIHLIGIGGAGMSGIAEILINLGFTVTGSDLKATPVTERLESLGARLFVGHHAENVMGADAVVYSSAVKEDNPEIIAARARKLPVIKRPEMLAELMRMKYGICIAGTHGKTTTTSMVAQVLTRGDVDPTVIVGGKVAMFGGGAKIGQSHYLVLEADEYDRTFLKLTPVIAVVTTVDSDHLDCYRDIEDIRQAFITFVNKVPFFGTVMLCIDDPGVRHIMPSVERRILTYGLARQADVRADNVVFHGMGSTFEVRAGGVELGSVTLHAPGNHNVRNALAAVAVGLEMGVPFPVIASALGEFRNADRRFQVIGEEDGIMVVDEYAHHPTEIRASLEGVHAAFDRRVIAVFQPHLYSRTRDFGNAFGQAFVDTDMLFVTDVFPARELPIEGVTGELVADAAKAAGHRDVTYCVDRGKLLDLVTERAQPGDIVITYGAGDINKVGYEFMERLKQRKGRV